MLANHWVTVLCTCILNVEYNATMISHADIHMTPDQDVFSYGLSRLVRTMQGTVHD
jgi:hypothetical protein